MTQTKDNGGPAFPMQSVIEVTDFEGNKQAASAVHMGMSLRDWFAGRAMQAFYSSFDARDASTSHFDLVADAHLFYNIADAMIKARKGGAE